MEKLAKFFGNIYTIIGVIGVIVTAAVFVITLNNNVKAQAEQNNKQQAQIEQIQLDLAKAKADQAASDKKVFDFVISLWQIQPDQASKWKEFPMRPPTDSAGNIIPGQAWIEFEGVDRLLKFKMVKKDSTLIPLVDTLYDRNGQSR